MKILFLCGGTGKRMFPITEDKFLLKFLGKTLLEHQIDAAVKAGLTDFIIVGNPGNLDRIQQITAAVPGIKTTFAVQSKPQGIANAIISARSLLDSEVIIVNPNDIFEGTAYSALTKAGRKGTSHLLGYEVHDYFSGGYLVSGKKGVLEGIVEKPPRGQEPSNLVTMLVHRHNDPEKLLHFIDCEPEGKDDVYERAVTSMARETKAVHVVKYTGTWTAIKYPWHVLDAVQYYLDKTQTYISPSASIAGNATIDGKVVIADNVRILENAVIRGPVYLGRNTVVGNNSLVRSYSHLGEDCLVGFGTEVKGSYLSDRCWLHKNYVGDSIVGENCSFGANTVTANWRFDEKNVKVNIEGKDVDTGRDKFGVVMGSNCKIGVSVSIMPGRKIGPDVLVQPGTCVMQDIAPEKGY